MPKKNKDWLLHFDEEEKCILPLLPTAIADDILSDHEKMRAQIEDEFVVPQISAHVSTSPDVFERLKERAAQKPVHQDTDLAYYDVSSTYPEAMLDPKIVEEKPRPLDVKRPEVCSLCGKISPLLVTTRNLDRGEHIHACEQCARGLLSELEASKASFGPPPQALSFDRETAHDVLTGECKRLAATAARECEQLVGDVLFGGGTIGQTRVATRFGLIHLLWVKRRMLTNLIDHARRSRYDAVPDLVAKANAVFNATSFKAMAEAFGDFYYQIEHVENVSDEIARAEIHWKVVSSPGIPSRSKCTGCKDFVDTVVKTFRDREPIAFADLNVEGYEHHICAAAHRSSQTICTRLHGHDGLHMAGGLSWEDHQVAQRNPSSEPAHAPPSLARQHRFPYNPESRRDPRIEPAHAPLRPASRRPPLGPTESGSAPPTPPPADMIRSFSDADLARLRALTQIDTSFTAGLHYECLQKWKNSSVLERKHIFNTVTEKALLGRNERVAQFTVDAWVSFFGSKYFTSEEK